MHAGAIEAKGHRFGVQWNALLADQQFERRLCAHSLARLQFDFAFASCRHVHIPRDIVAGSDAGDRVETLATVESVAFGNGRSLAFALQPRAIEEARVGMQEQRVTGRLLRDAKLYEIGAGTSEVRRMLIGRELFNATK